VCGTDSLRTLDFPYPKDKERKDLHVSQFQILISTRCPYNKLILCKLISKGSINFLDQWFLVNPESPEAGAGRMAQAVVRLPSKSEIPSSNPSTTKKKKKTTKKKNGCIPPTGHRAQAWGLKTFP
jgi:hypothetical protein